MVDVLIDNSQTWLQFWLSLVNITTYNADSISVVCEEWKAKSGSEHLDDGSQEVQGVEGKPAAEPAAAAAAAAGAATGPTKAPANFTSIVSARNVVRPPDTKVDSPVIASFMAQLQAFITTGATMGIMEKLAALIRPEVHLDQIGNIEAK